MLLFGFVSAGHNIVWPLAVNIISSEVRTSFSISGHKTRLPSANSVVLRTNDVMLCINDVTLCGVNGVATPTMFCRWQKRCCVCDATTRYA